MVRINQNDLAKTVTLAEGGKYNMTIAQVKECLRCNWEHIVDKYGSHGIARIEITETKAGKFTINAV